MTEPPDPPPEVNPLLREAIARVVQLTSGEATTADAAELKRWRAQSPEHEEAFRQAVKLWKGFGAAAAERARDETGPRPSVLGLDRVVARRAFIGGALAAAVAGYVVVRPPLELWPSWEELLADYRTAKGERRQIVVSPEVSVELSTLTSLAVRSSAQQPPSIELITGEAAVTANRPADAPLVMAAADGRVMASHASFNARCIDGVVSITCLAGSVEVESHNQMVRLDSGQQVSYSGAGLGSVASADVDKTTSWRSGMLIFQNKPLVDVIEEVNRYRPGRIVVTNGELGKRVVNGTFRGDEIDTFIAQIEQLFGAKVTRLPAGLLLLS